ncbi:MAG: FG-GAP-like repeat-containing protein [Saprospiraceae bacterium]|nr:FG-GAP-like repeat-containing protein [Saprospiraceae bacterium]
MKFLTAIGASLILISSINAQIGSVHSYQQITTNIGGFNAVLDVNDRFGISVDTIGDLNNDGIIDIAVGACFDDDGGTDRGAIYILYLDTNKTVKSYSKISSTSGNFSSALANGNYFGIGVSGLGDLDNDGVPDIAVGAENDSDGGSGTGAVWILFMNSNGTVKSYQKISSTSGYGISGLPLSSGTRFGGTVKCIGDINNDNIPDVVVGNYYDNGGGTNKGACWVLTLDTNGTVKTHYKIYDGVTNFNAPIDNDDGFGVGVSGIGDFDNDSIPDIAVGSFRDDDGGTDCGAVYIIKLNSNGSVKGYNKISNGNSGLSTNAFPYNANFGISVKRTSDIDGNGINDLLVGAWLYGSNAGAVYIIGLNSNSTASIIKTISSSDISQITGGNKFGYSVTHIGDINNDGKIEIAAGATGYNGDRGEIFIMSINLPYSSSISATHNLCNGQCNGMAISTAIGGTPPFTYLWSNNSTNDTITNLCAGVYTVTVTDSLSNITTSSITITQPPALIVSASANTSICAGSCTSLSATASGGSPPLFYMWSNGLGLGQTKQVCPTSTTSYTVNALDLNGCNSPPDTVIVNVIQPPIVSFSGLNAAYCQTASAVTLTGIPVGGTFSGNGISGNMFNPFTAGIGTHNIIYTYSNGLCSNTDTQSVIINPLPIVSFSGLDTAYCKNAATAILSGIPSGGTFNGSGMSGNIFNPSSLSPGYYPIVYLYTDANGCSNSQTQNTHINSVPLANAGTNITIQNNTNATLIGSASGGSGFYSYSWSPADSLIYANVQSPTTINLKSTNVFILTVTDLITGCQDTSHTKVTVAGLQISAFVNAFPQTICSGNSSQLIAYASGGSGIYTYSWASNPSGFTSSISNPVVSPSVTSTYTVTVSSASSSTTATIILTVNPTPIVSFSGLLSSYCVNSQAVTLTGNPSGGSFMGSGINAYNFSPSIAGSGTHQIIYSFTSSLGCFNSDTQTVVIHELPIVSFSGLAQNYCTNSPQDTLIGTPLGGTFSGTGINGNIFNPTIAGTGFFNITYSYSDANGCSNSISQTTAVNSIPIANAGTDKTIPCGSAGVMVGSSSTAGFSYSWLPTTGLSNPNIANPVASPNITTIYTLTITNNTTGCSATDYIIVTVLGGPTAVVSSDTSVCSGEMLNLSASGGISYLWSTGDSTANINIYPTITTNYSATVTDANGCSDADTVTVTIFPISVVNLGNDTTIKMSNSITIDAGAGFSSYNWSSGSTTQTHIVDGTTLGAGTFTFYVDVIDANQCSNSDTIVITINDDTGLDLITQKTNVAIYPNPANKLLFVKIQNNEVKDASIIVINSQAKVMRTYIVEALTKSPYIIDLIDFPLGLYFIQVRTDKFITSEKLIIY